MCVETIRRWRRVENLSISDIARSLGASRNIIKKYLKSEVTRPRYKQREKRCPVLGRVSQLALLLAQDYSKRTRERRTGKRLFDALSEEGPRGSYLTVPYP